MTPPTAKEPEVSGLEEVRGKLGWALRLAGSIRNIAGPEHPVVAEKARLIEVAIDEALALLESEQGEQIVIRADFGGEPGAGLHSYSETIAVSIGDPGGEPGEFQAFIIEALGEWFDGARVMLESEAIEQDKDFDAILATPTEGGEGP